MEYAESNMNTTAANSDNFSSGDVTSHSPVNAPAPADAPVETPAMNRSSLSNSDFKSESNVNKLVDTDEKTEVKNDGQSDSVKPSLPPFTTLPNGTKVMKFTDPAEFFSFLGTLGSGTLGSAFPEVKTEPLSKDENEDASAESNLCSCGRDHSKEGYGGPSSLLSALLSGSPFGSLPSSSLFQGDNKADGEDEEDEEEDEEGDEEDEDEMPELVDASEPESDAKNSGIPSGMPEEIAGLFKRLREQMEQSQRRQQEMRAAIPRILSGMTKLLESNKMFIEYTNKNNRLVKAVATAIISNYDSDAAVRAINRFFLQLVIDDINSGTKSSLPDFQDVVASAEETNKKITVFMNEQISKNFPSHVGASSNPLEEIAKMNDKKVLESIANTCAEYVILHSGIVKILKSDVSTAEMVAQITKLVL